MWKSRHLTDYLLLTKDMVMSRQVLFHSTFSSRKLNSSNVVSLIPSDASRIILPQWNLLILIPADMTEVTAARKNWVILNHDWANNIYSIFIHYSQHYPFCRFFMRVQGRPDRRDFQRYLHDKMECALLSETQYAFMMSCWMWTSSGIPQAVSPFQSAFFVLLTPLLHISVGNFYMGHIYLKMIRYK